MRIYSRILVFTVALAAIFILFSSFNVLAESGTNTTEHGFGLYLEDMISDYDISMAADVEMRTINPRTTTNTSKDLSSTNWFPPIGDQGSMGTCAAWASTYYQFTYEAARKNQINLENTPSNIYSPRYTWSYANDGVEREDGVSRRECFDILKQWGCISNQDFCFDLNSTTENLAWYNGPTDKLHNALKTRVSSTEPVYISDTNGEIIISSASDQDLNNIKNELDANRILTFDTYLCTWTYGVLSNGEMGIVSAQEKKKEKIKEDGTKELVTVGHALTIVGYDDSICYDIDGDTKIEPSEYGAFKLANSWGTGTDDEDNQHNDGFIWVMYGLLNGTIGTNEPFIYNAETTKITVDNYNPELTVEVKLGHNTRNQVAVELGAGVNMGTYYSYNYSNTYLDGIGGDLDFDGKRTNKLSATRTFVFDQSSLFGLQKQDYVVRINKTDGLSIQSVRWLNKNGKELQKLTSCSSSDSIYYYFNLDDVKNNKNSAVTVSMNSKKTAGIQMAGDVDVFAFTPSTSGGYLFYTKGSLDTCGVLTDQNGTFTDGNDDADIGGYNFAIRKTLEAGKKYYIMVSAYSSNTGNYELCVSKDFYEASLPDTNQDARCVQMSAEASSILDTMFLTIQGQTYSITKPSTGVFDGTWANGTRIQVIFESNRNGLTTVWNIKMKINPTATNTTDSITCTFSGGDLTNVEGTTLTGLVAYGSSVKTGVNDRASNSLQQLINSMSSSGYTLTVRNWDNSLVNVTSTTKAATGMKIIQKNSNNMIVHVYYVVVFGDVNGDGIVLLGDGAVDAKDALVDLKYSVDKVELQTLAIIAADANHDNAVDAKDALLIERHAVQKETIVQDFVVATIPDECYYLDPVTF